MATNYQIHPAVGIARLGSSEEFYIGPELPGVTAIPADGKYRDSSPNRLLRRQAARFRVFAAGEEVTVGKTFDGKTVKAIEWTAQLANKKAFWYEFDGLTGEGPAGYPSSHPVRNGALTDPMPLRRKKYVIDFGPRTLTSGSQSFSKDPTSGFPETFPGPLHNGNAVLEIEKLGEMHADAEGRLTIVGGFGKSGMRGGIPTGPLDFANNPEWFDDTSDGPVSARLIFEDDTSANAGFAWVLVGPPDFAPGIENLVTMYDLFWNLAVQNFAAAPTLFSAGAFSTTYKPLYGKEIYPILNRANHYGWVIQEAANHHKWNYDAYSKKPYAPPPPPVPPSPTRIFSKLRKPGDGGNAIDSDGLMPRLFGDKGTGTSLTLTPTQYHILQQWKNGTFDNSDWPLPSAPPTAITPEGLDRAALENCVGGAFFPGIEAGWILRDPRIFAGPFRLKPPIADEFDFTGLTPGSVTMRSALPWQADFLKCGTNWWPAQRPNQVRKTPTGGFAEWVRPITHHLELVKDWHTLGLVLKDKTVPDAFVEDERTHP